MAQHQQSCVTQLANMRGFLRLPTQRLMRLYDRKGPGDQVTRLHVCRGSQLPLLQSNRTLRSSNMQVTFSIPARILTHTHFHHLCLNTRTTTLVQALPTTSPARLHSSVLRNNCQTIRSPTMKSCIFSIVKTCLYGWAENLDLVGDCEITSIKQEIQNDIRFILQ
jgi:hypothetical protein